MNSLSFSEKKLFEDILVSGGYVLDFTNQTFANFFKEVAKIDIYSQMYAENGDSKGKRLRTFMAKSDDSLVIPILSQLLVIWKSKISQAEWYEVKSMYDNATAILDRYKSPPQEAASTEEQFLQKQFDDINLNRLQLEGSMVPILESRLNEARLCVIGAPLATIFLCGSVLEGILLSIAQKNPQRFNQAKSAPKKCDSVLLLANWNLSQLIDVAYELGFLGLDIKKFSHELRDFRNYIHPYQQCMSNFYPTQDTAKICLQVLKAAISSFDKAINLK